MLVSDKQRREEISAKAPKASSLVLTLFTSEGASTQSRPPRTTSTDELSLMIYGFEDDTPLNWAQKEICNTFLIGRTAGL